MPINSPQAQYQDLTLTTTSVLDQFGHSEPQKESDFLDTPDNDLIFSKKLLEKTMSLFANMVTIVDQEVASLTSIDENTNNTLNTFIVNGEEFCMLSSDDFDNTPTIKKSSAKSPAPRPLTQSPLYRDFKGQLNNTLFGRSAMPCFSPLQFQGGDQESYYVLSSSDFTDHEEDILLSSSDFDDSLPIKRKPCNDGLITVASKGRL